MRFFKANKNVIKWVSVSAVIFVALIVAWFFTRVDETITPVVHELPQLPISQPTPQVEQQPETLEVIFIPEGDAEVYGYALRVETRGNQQWDGIQISTHELGLEIGNSYTFSMDVFSPTTMDDVPVGLLLQTSAPLWRHVVTTPIFQPNVAASWYNLSGTLDLHDLDIVPAYMQLVKNNQGPNAEANLAFFVDNFTVTRDDGEIVAFFDFLDNRQPFTASGSAALRVAPAPSASLFRVNFDDDWDMFSEFLSAGSEVQINRAEGFGVGNEFSLRVANTTGNFYEGNYLRFNLPQPLQVGNVYEVSWWVLIPSNENEGKVNIPVSQLVLNGQFGLATHMPISVSQSSTIPMDRWTKTAATIVVHPSINRVDHINLQFNSANAENIPALWYVDNIGVTLIDNIGPAANWNTSLPSIRNRYVNHFMIGNVLDSAIATSNAFNTQEMFWHHYNIISTTNAMKPSSVGGAELIRPNALFLNDVQAIHSFAQNYGFQMIGNSLVCNDNTAPWLTHSQNGEILTRSEAMENLRWFIQNYTSNFTGIQYWNVVNNALTPNGQPSSVHLRPIGSPIHDIGTWQRTIRNDVPWYHAFANGADFAAGETAHDYIYYAFVYARRYAPSARLMFSDINTEQPNKRVAIVQMIDEINTRWLNDEENNPASNNPYHSQYQRPLIEAIGMKSHFTQRTNLNDVRMAIEMFAQAGVRVHVTELNIEFPALTAIPFTMKEHEQQEQADMYAELFIMYMELAHHIDSISFNSKDDGTAENGHLTPTLFDSFFRPKPAFWAVVDPYGWLNVEEPEDVEI